MEIYIKIKFNLFLNIKINTENRKHLELEQERKFLEFLLWLSENESD